MGTRLRPEQREMAWLHRKDGITFFHREALLAAIKDSDCSAATVAPVKKLTGSVTLTANGPVAVATVTLSVN